VSTKTQLDGRRDASSPRHPQEEISLFVVRLLELDHQKQGLNTLYASKSVIADDPENLTGEERKGRRDASERCVDT